MPSSVSNIHGVFLGIFDKGVLLKGPSGCGKSECALTLLSRGHQLIADDAPLFHLRGKRIIGSCPVALQNILEIRALGMVDVSQLYGKNALLAEKSLDLIIYLNNIELQDPPPIRKLALSLEHETLFGHTIPCLTLSLTQRTNVAILVESAVRLAFAPVSPTIERLVKTCD